jgi:hypothetical protein
MIERPLHDVKNLVLHETRLVADAHYNFSFREGGHRFVKIKG